MGVSTYSGVDKASTSKPKLDAHEVEMNECDAPVSNRVETHVLNSRIVPRRTVVSADGPPVVGVLDEPGSVNAYALPCTG